MSRSSLDLKALRPERVLIIKPSSLGDVVHALPVLAALRDLWPGAHLAWVINRTLRELVEGHPLIDEVILFDRARAGLHPTGIASWTRFLADLRRRRFDLAIDLQGLLRSGLMAAATGAPVRVGQGFAREGAAWFYTHQIPMRRPEPHAVDRLMDVVRAFGSDPGTPRFVLAVGEEDRRRARDLLDGVASPRLALNLGARWITKRWPPAHFAAVARRAVESLGAGLVAIGAPEDRPFVDQMRDHLGSLPLRDLCGQTGLRELAAVAEGCDLVLSNDTGPLHLAAATGTSVVGIYTCTSPGLTGPYGPNALAVQTGVWCAGRCVTRCDRMECMAELTPDRVWDAVRAGLTRSRSISSPAA